MKIGPKFIPNITKHNSDGTTSIQLTKGQWAIVTAADYELIKMYRWYTHRSRNTYYAVAHIRYVAGKRCKMFMHQVILPVEKPLIVDHRNSNGLDNQRCNLRASTTPQNGMNRGKQANNTSTFKGVYFHTRARKWQAQIQVNGRNMYLGLHSTPELAYAAYCSAADKYHGTFSRP